MTCDHTASFVHTQLPSQQPTLAQYFINKISDINIASNRPIHIAIPDAEFQIKQPISVDSIVKQNLQSTYFVRSDYRYGQRVRAATDQPPAKQFAELEKRFAEGWTIASDGTECASVDILELCQSISVGLGYICRANLYITPPAAKGFPPHFDSHDVFVIHLLGEKIWTIANHANCIPRRIDHSPLDLEINPDQAYRFTLTPGDILFIPKGFAHVVENLGAHAGAQLTLACTSLHIHDIIVNWLAKRLSECADSNLNYSSVGPFDLRPIERVFAAIGLPWDESSVRLAAEEARACHWQQMDHHATASIVKE